MLIGDLFEDHIDVMMRALDEERAAINAERQREMVGS